MYHPHLKRLIDITLASLGLVVLAIPLAIVALMIRRDSQDPAIFKQLRVGKGRREFIIYKFRTMSHPLDENGQEIPDQDRVTRLGSFLRRTSIDELPQLINVIKGDMSLVGPRPLLGSYLPFYTEQELKRFEALPGITGLAQIEGRHNASWDARLANDVAYVENISFMTDLKIIAKTFSCVLGQKDVIVAPPQDVAHLHIARARDMREEMAEAMNDAVVIGLPVSFDTPATIWPKQRRA
jgi:undecaprenyl phosphate N,N'-diacetylbacillosamine 1-phosphate transferase